MNSKRLAADLSEWPKDPFAVLGVARGVNRLALRRAYTSLLREFNPEHFPEHFRRIREAYEVVLGQVEAIEVMKSRQEGALSESPPLELNLAAEHESHEQLASAGSDRFAKPETNQHLNPAASICRWQDDLDALWDRAVGRESHGYRALVEMEARFCGRRDLCLRLYWLLVAWPEMDSGRRACDWLARGLRLGGLSGPLAELYRRELEASPEEALSEQCAELLDSDARPAPLADFAEARWRAAGRLDAFELIADDLELLRARMLPAAEDIWGRLILAAINEMCWSPSPEMQKLASDFWLELDELPHVHTQLRDSLDRAETIRMVAAGWGLLHRSRGVPDELLQLIRLSMFRPADEVIPTALDLLDRLFTNERQLLAIFDRIHKASPGLLAQVGYIIAICGGIEPTQPRDDAGHIRALAQFDIEAHYRNSYAALRPHLLSFCVREQVSPETLVRMPDVVLVRPVRANTELVRRIAADAPLRLVYLGHRALGV